jgi:hypothetical protein
MDTLGNNVGSMLNRRKRFQAADCARAFFSNALDLPRGILLPPDRRPSHRCDARHNLCSSYSKRKDYCGGTVATAVACWETFRQQRLVFDKLRLDQEKQ